MARKLSCGCLLLIDGFDLVHDLKHYRLIIIKLALAQAPKAWYLYSQSPELNHLGFNKGELPERSNGAPC